MNLAFVDDAPRCNVFRACIVEWAAARRTSSLGIDQMETTSTRLFLLHAFRPFSNVPRVGETSSVVFLADSACWCWNCYATCNRRWWKKWENHVETQNGLDWIVYFIVLRFFSRSTQCCHLGASRSRKKVLKIARRGRKDTWWCCRVKWGKKLMLQMDLSCSML